MHIPLTQARQKRIMQFYSREYPGAYVRVDNCTHYCEHCFNTQPFLIADHHEVCLGCGKRAGQSLRSKRIVYLSP